MSQSTSPLGRLVAFALVRAPQIAGLALAGALALSMFLLLEYRQALRAVRHTVDVQISVASVLDIIRDSESAVRGFFLSGDDANLAEFQGAPGDVNLALLHLQGLTADNPTQQTTIGTLKPAIVARFARWQEQIDLRRRAGLDELLVRFPTERRDAGTTPIRRQLEDMRIVEARLSRSRTATLDRITLGAGIAAGLFTAIAMAALGGLILANRRDVRAADVARVDSEHQEEQIRQMQKIEAVGQLTGGLAHDLNNMLAVIISGLSLSQKRVAAGNLDISRFLSAAMDGATRAATLTTRLMAFSRQLPLAPQALDPNRLVAGMAEMVQRTLGETVVTQTVLGAGLWITSVDASQLESAILNLSINARDAMPAGGKLTIETSNIDFDSNYARLNQMPVGEYVQIAITDTGSGMSREVVSKAFDPFFTTKDVGKGTGLGLSQVHGFIKQSGGHIKIYSEIGHGTTIKMYLPRLHIVGPAEILNTAKQEAWPQMLPAARAENAAHVVLVVEDDVRVSEMTVSSLRELGYTVIHASGAKRALELLDLHPGTQLLFTDIVMPEINGRQLAAEASKRRPDLLVVYTTGFTRNAIVHSGKLDAGLNFLAKPFTLVQLAAKMSEVLTPKAAA